MTKGIFISVLSLCLMITSCVYAQKVEKPIYISAAYKELVIGLDNPIEIVYSQDQDFRKEDISVEYQRYPDGKVRSLEVFERNGGFYLKPDSVGLITISVKTVDDIKSKSFRSKSIVPVGKLGRFGLSTNDKIDIGEFKAQRGVVANIESYDISGKCKTLSYEIIKIGPNGTSKRIFNKGSEFQDGGRRLILEAERGDLYLFRKIIYKCPGDRSGLRLPDMSFEIK